MSPNHVFTGWQRVSQRPNDSQAGDHNSSNVSWCSYSLNPSDDQSKIIYQTACYSTLTRIKLFSNESNNQSINMILNWIFFLPESETSFDEKNPNFQFQERRPFWPYSGLLWVRWPFQNDFKTVLVAFLYILLVTGACKAEMWRLKCGAALDSDQLCLLQSRATAVPLKLVFKH